MGGKGIGQTRMAILDNAPDADGVTITAASDCRVLLLAGRPPREPIASTGRSS